MLKATSKNGVIIRLPSERWEHIVTGHGELADMQQEVLDAIAEPERVLRGTEGELLAVREAEAGKWLIVIYRELGNDGFIITALLTRRRQWLEKREQLWP
jgi:hypothetical protein